MTYSRNVLTFYPFLFHENVITVFVVTFLLRQEKNWAILEGGSTGGWSEDSKSRISQKRNKKFIETVTNTILQCIEVFRKNTVPEVVLYFPDPRLSKKKLKA